MARLLIVDDDRAFRETLAETLESLGHAPQQASSGAEALSQAARTRFAAVFLNHRMPGMDGLEVLAALRTKLPVLPPVIVLTAYASSGNTIEAMRLGAFDHLTKPIKRQDVADVLARALHRHSARAHGPFVAIHCAAIPKELLESELFGHVRGAFTGATADRQGCFRAADGGVLLLDEIGDMAPGVQAQILRVLQEGEVTPLSGHRTLKIDVRGVAATHRDLALENVERLERVLIARALATSQGNRAEAARALGIHRQLLYRKLAQYRLD